MKAKTTANGTFILVPKNSGLKEYREKALSLLEAHERAKLIEARGEDIPFLVQQFQTKGKKAIGLTGEDLFKEYCLENRGTGLSIIRRIVWDDPGAMFRKPSLCLIGPLDKEQGSMPKELTVAINTKYRKLAKRYLNFLERQGFVFKKIYMNGAVETSCSEGIADLVIDIVYTGKSLEKYGLKVFDNILKSDFVIVGYKDDQT
ncbi:TPA: hypothetical protein HA281_05070 [Candidatus Woesearchaeota archaeon]|nr:hypothetical protein [Candidatus Woesearchaeota archaeon]HII64363.1 hypothetical protein [Candidatus Woesearchaeota archaeon]HIJ18621.1 hypothetical protein [Candidatus Woesearchaeota archaeon]